MDAFLDGDDLCAGCGRCCTDIRGLKVTAAELERVPRLARHVSRTEGPVHIVDLDGRCPYLGEDLRCTTFDTRPFDCSLYPVNVNSIGMRRPDGSVHATWAYGGAECPERPELWRRARLKGLDPVRAWVAEITGAERVVLEPVRGTRVNAMATVGLHRLGLLRLARRLTGRPGR